MAWLFITMIVGLALLSVLVAWFNRPADVPEKQRRTWPGAHGHA